MQGIIPVEAVSRNKIDRAINKLAMLINDSDDMRFIKHYQPFHLDERKKLIARSFYNGFDRSDLFYLKRMGNFDGYFTKRYNLDLTTWLPDQMLAKADRMTMAHSLEARVPFLDHELVEFSATIPEEMKFSLNASKIIVRDAASKFFSKEFVKRPKHGLAVPIDEMFRNDLKDKMLGIIEDSKTKIGLINHNYVKSIVKSHLDLKENNGQKILSIVSLCSWLENNGSI